VVEPLAERYFKGRRLAFDSGSADTQLIPRAAQDSETDAAIRVRVTSLRRTASH
jgi:hypothetical protein